MAVPALMLEWEEPVEERVARLEVNVEHIMGDVADIKIDTRRLNDKIDAVDQKQSARSDSLEKAIANLTLVVEKGFAEARIARAQDRVWWLLMSGAILGLMARAMHWI